MNQAPSPQSTRVSVVVASHDRCRRLEALLDALGDQRCREFEVIVVHDDGPGSASEALLQEHPLAAAGLLRRAQVAPGTGSAARMRNVGVGLARAPLVAFTDDDCRPDPGWLEALLAAADADPTAIVQGRTRPDPREEDLVRTRFLVRTLVVEPPTRFGQTCNIAYPRALLEDIRGFDERFRLPVGEDVDLLWRARRAGAAHLAAPAALVHHAIEGTTLRRRLRESPRYGQLARAAKRNPGYRRSPEHPFGRFAKRQHAELLTGIAGLVLAARRPAAALLLLPWLTGAAGRLRGYDGRGVRPIRRLAAWALIDAADILALARESARQRTVFL